MEEKKRKSAGRILFRIMIAAVLALVALAVVVLVYIDYIIAAGIRNITPEFTGTPTQVEDVKLQIFRGDLAINGLVIGNPPGYMSSSAIQFDSFSVNLDIGSVMSDKIIINEIRIVGPVISWEQGLSGSNLGDIQNNVEKMTASTEQPASASAAPQSAAGADAEKTASKKVVIRRLIIERAHINVGLKGVAAVSVPLPTLTLNDIGEGEGQDWTVAQAVEFIYEKLLLGIVAAAQQAGLDVGAIAGEVLKNAGQALSDIAESGADVLNQAAGQGAKALGDAAAQGAGVLNQATGGATGQAGDAVEQGVGKLLKGVGL